MNIAHYVTLGGTGTQYLQADKEEVFLDILTTWRGRSAVVRMQASRYVYGGWRDEPSTWSEWRIYASEAREATADGSWGDHLTPLAKSKLGASHKEVVQAWLDSEDYVTSERRAYSHAVSRVARDMRGYGTVPSQDLRTAVSVNGAKLSAETVARMLKVADAFDSYRELLDSSCVES